MSSSIEGEGSAGEDTAFELDTADMSGFEEAKLLVLLAGKVDPEAKFTRIGELKFVCVAE